MKQAVIKASEFKAKCLSLMDRVAETGTPITITKNGKPIATLNPVHPPKRSLLGLHAGLIEVRGDVVAPLDLVWNASR